MPVCQYCHKNFRSKKGLNLHLKEAHNANPEKQYEG